MTQKFEKIHIIAIDDRNMESLRQPFRRLGIEQADLCFFHLSESLLGGIRLIDTLADQKGGDLTGLSFLDMLFKEDSILPQGASVDDFESDIQMLEQTLQCTAFEPVQNGGILLLRHILASPFRHQVIPILYSALTEKTAVLAPLSQNVEFRIFPKMPYDDEVRQLLDELDVLYCSRHKLINYLEIQGIMTEFIQGGRPHSDFVEKMGKKVVGSSQRWLFQYLFPQVFGRADKLIRAAESRGIGDIDLSREFAHFLRLATAGHQGYVLRQFLIPEMEQYPDLDGAYLWKLEADDYIDERILLNAQLRFERFQSVLNLDTCERLAADLTMFKAVSEASGGSVRLGDFKDNLILQFTKNHVPKAFTEQIGQIARSAGTCLLNSEIVSANEWVVRVTENMQNRLLDSLLVMDIWEEVRAAARPCLSGEPVSVSANLDRDSMSISFSWERKDTFRLRPSTFTVPHRSLGRRRGVAVRVFASSNNDILCFEPYSGESVPVSQNLISRMSKPGLELTLTIEAVE